MRAPGLLLLLAVCSLPLACGKKGPPLPPIPRVPVPAAALEVRQVESTLEIVVPLPTLQMDGRPVGKFTGVKLYRLDGPVTSTSGALPALTSASFVDGLTPLVILNSSQAAALRPGGTYIYREPAAPFLLPARPGQEPQRFMLAYSARFRSAGRHWSPAQEPARLIPGLPPAAMEDFEVKPAPDGIELTWKPLPGAGVAVYRSSPGEPLPFRPLVTLPPGVRVFTDKGVRRGATVVYALRGVEGEGMERRFSRASASQQVMRIDSFPPAAPADVVALARPGGVDLFWTPGQEEDLAGYRVYRRRVAEEAWVQLSETLLTVSTWTDTTARPGEEYVYAVTAVDLSSPGNESVRSASQTVALPAADPPPPEAGEDQAEEM